MLKKTIKYTDYNGVERNEEFLFNLSKAELMEMEMGTTGGLADKIQRIVDAQDAPAIINIFRASAATTFSSALTCTTGPRSS